MPISTTRLTARFRLTDLEPQAITARRSPTPSVRSMHLVTSGSSVTGISLTTALSNGTGLVSPYFGDANNNGIIDNGELFCKPQSFQIISAGQDGLSARRRHTHGHLFQPVSDRRGLRLRGPTTTTSRTSARRTISTPRSHDVAFLGHRRRRAGAVCAFGQLHASADRLVPRETLAEIQHLSAALDAYRDRYGEYPPDFADPALVAAHIRRILPAYEGPVPGGLTAPQALVFWLSGFAEGDDPFALCGHRQPFFDFDPRGSSSRTTAKSTCRRARGQWANPIIISTTKRTATGHQSGAVGTPPCHTPRRSKSAEFPRLGSTASRSDHCRRATELRPIAGLQAVPGRVGWSPFDDDNLANFYDRTLGSVAIPRRKAGLPAGRRRRPGAARP